MSKKVTIRDIARELDVSISTVSKALRNMKEIGPETTQKIQAFAKLMNYKPNSIAISLKNRKTRNIGVIIPEIVHHFYSMVVKGVEEFAEEKGYNVIVCLSNESFSKEVVNMELLANGSIDGFIVAVAKETMKVKDFHPFYEVINQGMPLVMFDRVVENVLCDKVVVDDLMGAYYAVNHLLETGCKRIAILTTVDYINVGKMRTDGYLKALAENGFPVVEELILKIEDIDNCEEEIQELFESQNFDAVFSVNELFAVLGMRNAIRQGRKIPEDISFIAFTDSILSKSVTPALSTVTQHAVRIGKIAAQMLIDRLDDEISPDGFSTQIVKTSIIERETTKSTKILLIK